MKVKKIEPYDPVVVNAPDIELVDPHSALRLPGQSWTDFLMCLVISFVAPFQKVVNHAISRDPNPIIDAIRDTMKKQGPSGEKALIEQWSASLDNNDIIQVDYMIPRRAILQEWGVLKGDYAKMTKAEMLPEEDIEVLLRFSVSAYQDEELDTANLERNEFGCLSLDASKFDLKQLNTGDVPLVVFFHGGGLVVGTNHEDTVIELVVSLASGTDHGIILASVKYSLSPEYPFPAAACDGCTVVSHMLDRIPKDHNVHIMGSSGGTQPAAISTMECVRKYPGRIESCHLMLPMIDPGSDSFSCYINGTASMWITAPTGRWLWCLYLGLPFLDQEDPRLANGMSQRLGHCSNRAAWETWCETNNGRLVNPALQFPEGLDQPSAPTFLVHTNAGDPIRDDGAILVNQLKAIGARVHHNEDNGTHWWGTKVGTTGGIEKLALAWKDVLFARDSKK